MKVAVADDEILECEALEEMLAGNFPMITVVPSVNNGQALLELVKKEKPDIVIVDINMPGLNGLEALEILRNENFSMEIIIHTAYSKFDYIHKALKLGAFDYLVKPVFEEDFVTVFTSVLQLVQKKQKSIISREIFEKDNMGNIVENNVMMSILLHKPEQKNWELLVKKWNIEQGEFLMLIFRTEKLEFTEQMQEKIQEEAEKRCNCITLIREQNCYCLLATERSEEEWELLSETEKWISGFIRKQRNHYENELYAGVSTVKLCLDDLPAAMEEAETALNHDSEDGVGFYRHKKIAVAENIFSNIAGKMADYMKEDGDIEKILQVINDRIDTQPNRKLSFSICFYAMEQLTNMAVILDIDKRRCGIYWFLPECIRRMNEFHEKQCETDYKERENEEKIWEMDREDFLKYMEQELTVLKEYFCHSERKSNEYVERAMIYMERQYMKNELSMDQTAEQLGITSFYLSRLFKQEKNATFLEILTEIRVTKAIHFLMNPSKSVQSIAAMAGYNIKYFYKVFKSTTGLSQREFRKAMLIEE